MTIDKLKRKYENKKPSAKIKNETELAEIDSANPVDSNNMPVLPACTDANAKTTDIHPSAGSGFGSWQDSAPVLRLSAYLRANLVAGIRLCKSDGEPSLLFDPPLGLADMTTERWRIALNAIDLAQSAMHDLKILLLNGLIDLPDKQAQCGKDRVTSGSSGKERQTGITPGAKNSINEPATNPEPINLQLFP